MSQKMTPINPESLFLLAQIARQISELSGHTEEEMQQAHELYDQALSIMLVATPSVYQREWNKVTIARTRIGHEHVMDVIAERKAKTPEQEYQRKAEIFKQIMGEEPGISDPEGSLTPEEEELYRKAIEDENHFPSSYP